MMFELIQSLSLDDIIEFHNCCSLLLANQMIEAGEDWLVLLDENIGLETVFRWSAFVGKAIGEDFRHEEFKEKSQQLSNLLQDRFSAIGLDITLISNVFFFFGLIYTYAKHIGFLKVYHLQSVDRIEALSRFDEEFAVSIRIGSQENVVFVDTRSHDPIQITQTLIETAMIGIEKIEIYVEEVDNLPSSFNGLKEVTIHHFSENQKKLGENVTLIGYWI